MTRMNLSHNPRFGSKTRPPLYLSFFPFVLGASGSASSCLTTDAAFLPYSLSGTIYLRRWNSCSRMYSFRSARPPFRVLLLNSSEAHISLYRRRHVPCVPSQVCQLLCQWQDLYFSSNSHLVMCIEFAMLYKFQHPVRRTKTTIKVAGSIIGIDFRSLEVEVSPTHLSERPCRRYNHTLGIMSLKTGSWKRTYINNLCTVTGQIAQHATTEES